MGATVLHGIEGFGPAHHLSTDRLPDVSDNLPLIIEIVDSAESVERFLPVLDQLVQHGMMTVVPVEIIYSERER
jgi:PII-like signaling protein